MSTCCEVFCLLSLVGLVTSSGVASGYLQVRCGAVGSGAALLEKCKCSGRVHAGSGIFVKPTFGQTIATTPSAST